MAVIQDNEPMVKFLLEKGAGRNIWKIITLHQLFIYASADPNLEDQYYPRSHQAANVRQVDFSEDLLPYRDYREYTALHYAVIICNPNIVKLLLNHLADPLVRNSHGLTPREYLYYVERFTGEQNTEIEELLHSTYIYCLIIKSWQTLFKYI